MNVDKYFIYDMAHMNGIKKKREKKKTKTFEKYDTQQKKLAVKHAWYTHLMHNEWAGLIYKCVAYIHRYTSYYDQT